MNDLPAVTSGSRSVCTDGHAARRLLAGVALTGLLGVGATGCIIVRGDDDGGETEPPPAPPPVEVYSVGIDEGATLDAEPGQGVGIYVEYEGDGRYRIWTTCDTDLSGYACAFDLFAIGAGLARPVGEDLEPEDEVSLTGDELYAYLETSGDTDGFRFSMIDGEPMRLEVYLDGYSEPRFVYWVSGGVLQRGAPSNPVDFQP